MTDGAIACIVPNTLVSFSGSIRGAKFFLRGASKHPYRGPREERLVAKAERYRQVSAQSYQVLRCKEQMD